MRLLSIRRVRLQMSIIYTVIARGEVLLVDFTPFSGNFLLTAQQILKMCTPSRKYVKYSANNYIFYVLYIGQIYMVMCDDKYSQRIAFSYLEKIKKLFTSAISPQKIERATMYSCKEFESVLRNNMELYNSPDQVDNVARLVKEAEEVNQIVNQDLQKLIERGEKIEVLVKKTETMSALSLDLSSTARVVKNEMMCRNWKWRIMFVCSAILVVYFIFVIICGNFNLSNCF